MQCEEKEVNNIWESTQFSLLFKVRLGAKFQEGCIVQMKVAFVL